MGEAPARTSVDESEHSGVRTEDPQVDRGRNGPINPTRPSLILGSLVVALIVGVVATLDAHNTEEYQVIIGGLAGAVAASVALMLRGGGLSEVENALARRGAVAIFVPVITGLAAGAFSVLTAIALFSSAESLASAAVFGGLYGLLLGGWSNSVVGRAKALEEPTLLQAALAEIGGGVGRRRMLRYNGAILARFEPARGEHERVLGALRVVFVPTERSDERVEDWLAGPVRIDDGEVADSVPFEVSIISDAELVVYPRMREVVVPAGEISDEYDFTVVRNALPADDTEDRTPIVLVDIAQAARTVQVLEISLPMSHPTTDP